MKRNEGQYKLFAIDLTVALKKADPNHLYLG
jgi:hypothetical protein